MKIKQISNLPGGLGIVIGLAGGITQNTTALVVAWAFLVLALMFVKLEHVKEIEELKEQL